VPSIIDFKNSLREKQKDWIVDYFCQGAAYQLAHNNLFGTEISQIVIMIATRDGKYQEFIINGNENKNYVDIWLDKVDKYYTQVK